MTPRSPKQQHSKTTTISRRLRNRADQDLSVQPQEISQLRLARPRRAATLPTSRQEPTDFPPINLHQHPFIWETEEAAEDPCQSATSVPSGIVEHQPEDIILEQNLDFVAYESAQSAHTGLASATEPHTAQKYGHHHTSGSETSPPPLPPVSESIGFDLLSSAHSHQPHNSFVDLQDMR